MTLALVRPNVRISAACTLLSIAFLWGATFVPVKVAVVDFPVLGFIGLRFLFALLLLAPIGIWRLRKTTVTKRQVLQGFVTGWIFLIGYAFQTFGLRYTGAGRAAFVTGLNTIFVPIILVIFFRDHLRAKPIIGAVLATVGMAVLSLDGIAQGSLKGDLIVLGAAISFAVQVILTSRWGSKMDPVLFTLLQVAAVVPFAFAGALLWEGPIPALQSVVINAALFTGVVVTGLGLLAQVWAQRIISPTHTAVIFATEPVFGALFGWLLAGEILSVAGFTGCGLILAGMLVAESG